MCPDDRVRFVTAAVRVSVGRMAALASVWLCTEECSFVRAERIIALSIRSRDDGPLARMPDGDVRISARTDEVGAVGDGPYATVLTCASDHAPGLLAELARVLTEAADHPESCAFVHAKRPDGERPSWTISSEPSEAWPP